MDYKIVLAKGAEENLDRFVTYLLFEKFQRIVEVEKVLLRTLGVKSNVGKGTPTNDSLV